MKILVALLGILALIVPVGAKEPAKKSRESAPGHYPPIIQLNPAGEPQSAASKGIIQSELGGREVQFLQSANRAGQEELALAELARNKGSSDQIAIVAETIASTQATESKEVARLAEAKHIALAGAPAKAQADQLAALSGPKFDKAWIERLIAVSEESAAAYEAGAKSQDAEIRSFAEKMLPVANARLQVANRLGGRSVATKAATPAANPKPSAKPAAPEAPLPRPSAATPAATPVPTKAPAKP
ncbi:MAG TPA: DUF4142 domain-containing protein [Chthoniobacteraceae bacterium]|nr:DUF4142 domain-containing protein [Chthoniobacteraceae bacterium]